MRQGTRAKRLAETWFAKDQGKMSASNLDSVVVRGARELGAEGYENASMKRAGSRSGFCTIFGFIRKRDPALYQVWECSRLWRSQAEGFMGWRGFAALDMEFRGRQSFTAKERKGRRSA